jgi:hypothetical protein
MSLMRWGGSLKPEIATIYGRKLIRMTVLETD